MHFTSLAASALTLTFLAGSAQAVQISLEPIRDNTLIETADGSRSNGAFDRLFAGRTNQMSGSIRRGVLAFDVAGALPAGAILQSVTLELRHISGNAASDVSIHRLVQDWGEGDSNISGGQGAPSALGDATWLHTFFDTAMPPQHSFWATAGGDFVAAASATTAVDPSVSNLPAWTSAQMLTDVQGWLDDSSSQFGWVLIGNESMSQTTLVFGTREQLLAQDRPRLTIQYTPEPGTAVQLSVGLALLATRRRRGQRS